MSLPVSPLSPDHRAAVLSTLAEVFGYTELRPGQAEAIEAVLAGRNVFAVMPTGAGKSLCYQLPALILGGLTLVVSPLLALMAFRPRDAEAASGHPVRPVAGPSGALVDHS